MNPPVLINGVPVFKSSCFPIPTNNVHIQKSTEYPEYVGVLHRHEYIEIVYVISGTSDHIINDTTVKAKKGDLFIINSDVSHAFMSNSDNDEQFCTYDLMFTPELFDVDTNKRANNFDSLNCSFLFRTVFENNNTMGAALYFTDNENTEFSVLMRKIYNEYHDARRGYINIIRAYIIQLIVQLSRQMELPISETSSPRRAQMINQTIEYLHDNFRKSISVSELAEMIHVSPSYFGKLFYNATGMNLTTYLKKLRINAVCKLLLNTDHNITDIARSCGIEDMKSFYAAFRSETGLTPGEYRKKSKKKS